MHGTRFHYVTSIDTFVELSVLDYRLSPRLYAEPAFIENETYNGSGRLEEYFIRAGLWGVVPCVPQAGSFGRDCREGTCLPTDLQYISGGRESEVEGATSPRPAAHT